MDILLGALRTTSEILAAGIAITAASLLLYALSFNLRDRVARSFALIMGCVGLVFSGQALSSASGIGGFAEFWLQFQWIGLVFLPPAYLHHSDALLATTGRPSRGRRRLLVRLAYAVSMLLALAIPAGFLVGPIQHDEVVAFLSSAALTVPFALYYLIFISWSAINFWRAYRRTVTGTGRRRMGYLLAGAAAPALGSLPYLLFSTLFTPSGTLVFWIAAITANVVVWWLLILMAYSVAFFGVSWPDRIVRRRLIKWLMRGPITALAALGVTTLINRTGDFLGMPDNILGPVAMVLTILLMEHAISLASPYWERLVNYRENRDLALFRSLEERLLTSLDLRQFLETVLAAVCDQFQSGAGFVATFENGGIEHFLTQGGQQDVYSDDNFLQLIISSGGPAEDLFSWGPFSILVLRGEDAGQLHGLMGVLREDEAPLTDDEVDAFERLGRRAALALDDRYQQQQIYNSLESLATEGDLLRRLRAISRYDREGLLTAIEDIPKTVELSRFVKDGLSHYWGGPKLSKNPLIGLQIVQRAVEQNDDNPANALRSILQQALDRIKPEGERRFTAEWILYNILEMKFLQGRKVRDVALRLAMSEADLYRKQRVALEAIAVEIVDMERQAREENGHPEAYSHTL
jgi:hypothetical protein